MELVVALIMYLGISLRSTNNAQLQCMKVNAVIKEGKIISISKAD